MYNIIIFAAVSIIININLDNNFDSLKGLEPLTSRLHDEYATNYTIKNFSNFQINEMNRQTQIISYPERQTTKRLPSLLVTH